MEEWEDKFKKSLDGFEVETEGVSLDDVIARTGRRRRQLRLVPFFATAVGVAAAVAVVALIGFGGRGPADAPAVMLADNEPVVMTGDIPAPEPLNEVPSRHTAALLSGVASDAFAPESEAGSSSEDADGSISETATDSSSEIATGSTSEDASGSSSEDAVQDTAAGNRDNGSDDEAAHDGTITMDEWLAANQDNGKESSGRLRLGLEGSGISLSSLGSSSADQALQDGIPSASALMADGDPIYKQNTVNDEADHRHPVRFALTVAYPLSSRISLVSGLMYSHHSSSIDRTVGNSDSYITYPLSQKLDFIGIPLGAEYQVLSLGGFSVAAHGGFAAEKLVHGKLTSDGAVPSDILPDGGKNLSMKKLQFSANASAVLSYMFNDHLGVYFQPGVSYYFDNSSSLSTFYSNHPFAADFRLGLRFALGR